MMGVRYAYKVMARDGEAVSGDAVLAQVTAESSLFALIDALGHGDGAYRVAQRAIATLQKLPPGVSCLDAMLALQKDLHGTRGAAATLCTVRGLSVELIGLGNVNCRTLGEMPFVTKPGVVGGAARRLVATPVTMRPGQRLVFHSDGVSHRFDLRTVSLMSPDEACAFILRHQRYPYDDASVLVVDVGASAETRP